MQVLPLGDAALLVPCPTEAGAAALAARARAAAPPWLRDAVPAYRRVGLFFDPEAVDAGQVARWLDSLPDSAGQVAPGATHAIPVCYEMGLDLVQVARSRAVTADEVIRLHHGTEYAVHAVGFVPGFPYMGYLPEPLAGVARLASPRVRVEPGSVGVAGRQTGIYPLPRPAGWPILGRTPLTLVDPADGFFPIRVGDRVRFERIDERRFAELAGERLPLPPPSPLRRGGPGG